jgi:long-chain acyl-CoA synthetase
MPQRTLFAVLEETAAQYGSRTALFQPVSGRSARYETYTWNEYRDAAREIACGLRAIGIGKGDCVAMHSETRAEFYLADMGVMTNGSVSAALYTSLPPAEHVRTVNAARPKALVVEDPKTMEALREAGVGSDGMQWILLTGQSEDAIGLAELRKKGRAALSVDPALFDKIRTEVQPEDYAILYLTSGATGEPKMGLATQRAVVSNIDMGPEVVSLGSQDRALAFLPSAHIAQRLGVQLLPMRTGMPVYFSQGLTKLPNELKEVRPTFFLAPPRVWERVYSSICTEIRKRPAVTRKLFYGALGLGLRAGRYRLEGKSVPLWMKRALAAADKVVFSKIRDRFGGQLRLAVSGAAPLGRDLAQFYEAIGMPLMEGYGLTEGGVVALNPPGETRPGSIGKPLPGVHFKLGDDGEVLLSGPTLFSGYLDDPVATASVLKDGWLHTGDIGEVDASGYIYITGRKKELIVSSNGKKIYPARIESLFKIEPLINQILLIGDRQPYVTALITINAAAAEGLKGMEALKGAALEQVAVAPAVLDEVNRAVKRVNGQLAPFEQIKRFRVLRRDFSIDKGELTPTMKVRRTQVIENFREAVGELYLGREES